MDDEQSRLFNAYYYAHDCGEPYLRNEVWLNRFAVFAKRIHLDIQPATVLDAGCALGLLVEVLRKTGIEAWGIDISEYAIQNAHPEIRDYCQVGSITAPFPLPHYDLIVCIEVLEHLPKEEAEKAIANLCQHSDDILFSSTPNDYQEATHFNVQPSEYWVELFARNGFFRDVDYDASYITPWAIRFRRQETSLVRLARNYERIFAPLSHTNNALRRHVIADRELLEENERQISEMQVRLTRSAEAEQHAIELRAEVEQHTLELSAQLNAAHAQIHELAKKIQTQDHRHTADENRLHQLEHDKQDLEHQLLTVQSQLNSIQQHSLYKFFKILRRPFK